MRALLIAVAALVILPSATYADSCDYAMSVGTGSLKRSASRLEAITQRLSRLVLRVKEIDERMSTSESTFKLNMENGVDPDILRQNSFVDVLQGMISYRKVVADLTSLGLDLDNEWRDRQATLGEIIDACAR